VTTGSAAAPARRCTSLRQARGVKRLLVFVYIYDGTPAFDRAHAKVDTFRLRAGIEIPLSERHPQGQVVRGGADREPQGRAVVRREVKYVYGFQAEIDRLYGGASSGDAVQVEV